MCHAIRAFRCHRCTRQVVVCAVAQHAFHTAVPKGSLCLLRVGEQNQLSFSGTITPRNIDQQPAETLFRSYDCTPFLSPWDQSSIGRFHAREIDWYTTATTPGFWKIAPLVTILSRITGLECSPLDHLRGFYHCDLTILPQTCSHDPTTIATPFIHRLQDSCHYPQWDRILERA